jgi:hypothetical protein
MDLAGTGPFHRRRSILNLWVASFDGGDCRNSSTQVAFASWVAKLAAFFQKERVMSGSIEISFFQGVHDWRAWAASPDHSGRSLPNASEWTRAFTQPAHPAQAGPDLRRLLDGFGRDGYCIIRAPKKTLAHVAQRGQS